MELKLTDGRYVLNERKSLKEIDGAEELAQRVALKLQVHRGAFWPMPAFGSRLYQLGRIPPAERETAARQFVREALEDEENLFIDALELKEKAGDAVLHLTLTRGNETLNVETGI